MSYFYNVEMISNWKELPCKIGEMHFIVEGFYTENFFGVLNFIRNGKLHYKNFWNMSLQLLGWFFTHIAHVNQNECLIFMKLQIISQ